MSDADQTPTPAGPAVLLTARQLGLLARSAGRETRRALKAADLAISAGLPPAEQQQLKAEVSEWVTLAGVLAAAESAAVKADGERMAGL
jgi:hypothetical protein